MNLPRLPIQENRTHYERQQNLLRQCQIASDDATQALADGDMHTFAEKTSLLRGVNLVASELCYEWLIDAIKEMWPDVLAGQ